MLWLALRRRLKCLLSTYQMEELYKSEALPKLFENILTSFQTLSASMEAQLLKFFTLSLASGREVEITSPPGHHPMAVVVVKVRASQK